MSVNYYVCGSMLERYQRYTSKLANVAELKDCFVDDIE